MSDSYWQDNPDQLIERITGEVAAIQLIFATDESAALFQEKHALGVEALLEHVGHDLEVLDKAMEHPLVLYRDGRAVEAARQLAAEGAFNAERRRTYQAGVLDGQASLVERLHAVDADLARRVREFLNQKGADVEREQA